MKSKIFTILLISLSLLVSAYFYLPSVFLTDKSCFGDFKFSNNIDYEYGVWMYRAFAETNLEACLPDEQYSLDASEYPDTSMNKFQSLNINQFHTNFSRIIVPKSGSDIWFSSQLYDIPFIDVILRQAKDPAEGALQKWIEDRFSFDARGLTSEKLRAGCKRIGYPAPYQIRYDLPFEKFGENSEFTKFQACNDIDNWYAVRVGTQVILLKNDHVEPLEGMNEELLLNIIRSIKPVKTEKNADRSN